MITKFEHFPNELILICFRYFHFYCLYEKFSCLNQRFNKLILHQANIYIDLNSISDGDFLTFCLKLDHFLTITKNYPLSISTYNEQRFILIGGGAKGWKQGETGQNGRKAENVCSIGCPSLFPENFLSSVPNFQARYQLKTFFLLSMLVFQFSRRISR